MLVVHLLHLRLPERHCHERAQGMPLLLKGLNEDTSDGGPTAIQGVDDPFTHTINTPLAPYG